MDVFTFNTFAATSLHVIIIMFIVLMILVKLSMRCYISASLHLIGGTIAHIILENSPLAKLGEVEYLILFTFAAMLIFLFVVIHFAPEEKEGE